MHLPRGLAVVLLLLALSSPTAAHEPAYIAIIIDDIGNNLSRGQRTIELPAPLTLSVLPYTRYAQPLARRAYRAGKEVMVHMPMANVHDKPIGPGGLQAALSHDEFTELVDRAMARVPHARGLNNHMGSYLTQQTAEMTWLMEEMKQRRLFFVDSRTTPKTVAQRIAKEKAVFSSRRDVFLDNEQSFYEVDRAFRKLIALARRNGTAIGIGHPHEVTLDYLEMVLPGLTSDGIYVLPVSNLIAVQEMLRVQFARHE